MQKRVVKKVQLSETLADRVSYGMCNNDDLIYIFGGANNHDNTLWEINGMYT